MEEEVAVVEFEGEHRFGGHDFEFVDELSPGQTCSICLLAMRNPVQTARCGHRFCESCLLGTFREGHDKFCPQDRNPIPEDGGFFRDIAWERQILCLRVKCKKSDRGCDWIGQLRYYEKEHFNLCEYEDVTCVDCDKQMQRRLLLKHTTSECDNRIVQCEYCEEEFQFRDTQVESHVKNDCMMTLVVCPYEGAGCTFHDKRSNLETHLQFSSEEHLSKTWSKLSETTERLIELESSSRRDSTVVAGQVMALRNDRAELRRQFEDVDRAAAHAAATTLNVENDLNRYVQNMVELRRQLEEVKRTAASSEEEIRSLKRRVQTMQTKLDEKQPERRKGHLKRYGEFAAFQ